MRMDEKRRIILGFVLAPAMVIIALTLFSGDLAIVVLMVGIPVAYFCALVIGGPLFVLMRKFQLTDWSWTMLAGALAALPFLILYLQAADFHVQIHGIINSLFITLIGVLGSLVFWFIAIRGSDLQATGESVTLGRGLFALFLLALFYLLVAGRLSDHHGVALREADRKTGDRHKVALVKLANGEHVQALLPKTYPVRANCPVHLTSRRSLISLRPLYWIITYKDSFYVGEHWQNLTPQALAKMDIKLPPANCKPVSQPDD